MKPEKILAHEPRILSREQRESYFENGYLLLDSFITGERLEQIRGTVAAFVEQSRAVEASGKMFDVEPGHTAEAPRLRRLNEPVEHHPVFWDYARDSPITDVAADLLGPDVVFHHSKLNFKWSGGGEEVKWHQDIPFYPHTNYSVLAIGLYLNDVDDEMGPMGIVPGSHRGEIFNHYNERDQWVGALDDKDVARVPTETAHWLKGPAGSVTVHHSRAVHGSVPNSSPRPRPLLINAFSSADALQITSHPFPGPKVGTVVRGKAARWVDFDDTPCLLPPDWAEGYSSIFALQQEERETIARAAVG